MTLERIYETRPKTTFKTPNFQLQMEFGKQYLLHRTDPTRPQQILTTLSSCLTDNDIFELAEILNAARAELCNRSSLPEEVSP